MSRTIPSKQISKREAMSLLLSRGACSTGIPGISQSVSFVPSKVSTKSSEAR